MNEVLRALLVEDYEPDAELILNKLYEAGYKTKHSLTDSGHGMRTLLCEGPWDVILCDYSMPGFNASEAIKILKEFDLDIPFILVSGAVGEENVVKLMKEGCHDCIMKNNMIRLPSVIDREIQEARIRKDNKLMKEKLQKYQIFVEKANDAMMFLDKEGNILEVNEAAVRIYGYSYEEFLSKSIFDLRLNEEKSIIISQMGKANNEGIAFETVHYRKDGTFFHAEVSSKGTLLGSKWVILSIVRDITERKKYIQEIIKAKEEAEVANKAKSQFLANMSHEIRTPMNGIIGMTDLTLMTELDEKQRDCLNIVKSSTKSLLRVLNDILDYSKIESGRIDLERHPFEIKRAIYEVAQLFDVAAKQKGLSLKVNIDERVPEIIIGDNVRIKQVLSNLIGNAIKFTSRGGVTVDVLLIGSYDKRVKLNFRISDTGIGISEENIKSLFQSFYQVDSSNTRKFGGTGLGLVISKNLIELMQGQIEVKSEEGIGSAFRFTAFFDVLDGFKKEIDYETNYKVKQNMLQGKFVSKKVLIAEDDETNRIFASLVLKGKGLQVITALNGKEAVEKFEQNSVDLIFMDINMPLMDGYSATSAIRKKDKKHTPIIAMTAHAFDGDRQKCIDVGMDDYICKPIDLQKFHDKIEKWLNLY